MTIKKPSVESSAQEQNTNKALSNRADAPYIQPAPTALTVCKDVGNTDTQRGTIRAGEIDLASDSLQSSSCSSALDFDSSSNSSLKSSFSGAPPSNTAPSNYINQETDNKILRFGIDSLYLSYHGDLSSEWEQRLEGLKLAAQSQEESDKATAQVQIGNHLFEVQGKGGQRFSFSLVDNCYHIQLSRRTSKSMPLAYVQISSELLTTLSPEEAVKNLSYVIRSFGLVKGEPQISRADLFVDFTSPVLMDSWHSLDWVTRAHLITPYYNRRQFTGWAIGQGGNVGARLYNKTLELEKSKKDYLKPLWKNAGWDEKSHIWRLEFQYRREVLKQLSILEFTDLLKHLSGLWAYSCNNWLRLTIPNKTDSNQTRWPNHPLWDFLSAVDWNQQQKKGEQLKRIKKERIPTEESLFINGLGGITSFMASKGIEDLGEGFAEYLVQAESFHEHKGRFQNKGLSHYIQEKVKAKSRKYNTLDNRDTEELEKIKREQAKAYKKEKGGG